MNPTRQNNNFTAEYIRNIVHIYNVALENRTQLDFENLAQINENELHFWIGINHHQFTSILQQTPSLRRRCRQPNTALGVYLTKIRTGDPNQRIATLFGLSRRTLERHLNIARLCLTNDFVPQHLGFDHLTREDIIRRNLIVPNHIFGNNGPQNNRKVIAICDGTYIYIQKSSNYLFQRLSYSLHKFRHLVKPFLIVSSDGYIIEVTGPYAATTSDANIICELLQDEDSLFHWFFEQNDVFVLDRGFRDAIPLLEEFGYQAHIPPSRNNETQLSTSDANKSRLITMCRWVVEAINGRIKRDFKIFREKYFNRALPDMFADFRIAAALINTFQQPYEDSQYAASFIQLIDEKINKPNLLADYVEENSLNRRRTTFRRMEANHVDYIDFPRLTREDLILFALGTYHIRIAKSYCYEHMRNSGVYEIELFRNSELINLNNYGNTTNVLIRGRIQSRHIRAKIYFTYIYYAANVNGRKAILETYCSCIHGRRTLGSCSHIMSIIYYLGFARHEPHINQPAAFLNNVIIDY